MREQVANHSHAAKILPVLARDALYDGTPERERKLLVVEHVQPERSDYLGEIVLANHCIISHSTLIIPSMTSERHALTSRCRFEFKLSILRLKLASPVLREIEQRDPIVVRA
jgi:hypothetical protein